MFKGLKFLVLAMVLCVLFVGCNNETVKEETVKDKAIYEVTDKNGVVKQMTHSELFALQNELGEKALQEIEISGTGVVKEMGSTIFSNTDVKKNGNRGRLEFTIKLDTGIIINVDLYLADPGYNAKGKKFSDIQWFAVGDKIKFNTGNSDVVNDVIGQLVQESGTCTSVNEDGSINVHFDIILENTNGFYSGVDVIEAFHDQSTEIVKIS